MRAELRPCPFCGAPAELKQNVNYATGGLLADEWYATCPPCDLIRDQAWAVPREEAITAWNTRAMSLPMKDEIKKTIVRARWKEASNIMFGKSPATTETIDSALADAIIDLLQNGNIHDPS